MLRIAFAAALAASLAGAQTEVPASEWKTAATEIRGEAALIRVAAQDVAAKPYGLAVDHAAVRQEIENQQVRAARIQTKLYEVERAECARGLYQDSRLDRLKSAADRLTDLTAVQRSTLGDGETKPKWGVLKRQAKSTSELAEKIEKDVARFAE
ncbi:hypothetical protein [Paludibaculum fermentans]|uniref:hypothetical protein n=1 Tax=Paludibaculum fermentans TaxID=1473598 RepID=UPI003EBBFC61